MLRPAIDATVTPPRARLNVRPSFGTPASRGITGVDGHRHLAPASDGTLDTVDDVAFPTVTPAPTGSTFVDDSPAGHYGSLSSQPRCRPALAATFDLDGGFDSTAAAPSPPARTPPTSTSATRGPAVARRPRLATTSTPTACRTPASRGIPDVDGHRHLGRRRTARFDTADDVAYPTVTTGADGLYTFVDDLPAGTGTA